jgi:hypothetical protein
MTKSDLDVVPVLELLEVALELGEGGAVGPMQCSIRDVILVQGWTQSYKKWVLFGVEIHNEKYEENPRNSLGESPPTLEDFRPVFYLLSWCHVFTVELRI